MGFDTDDGSDISELAVDVIIAGFMEFKLQATENTKIVITDSNLQRNFKFLIIMVINSIVRIFLKIKRHLNFLFKIYSSKI